MAKYQDTLSYKIGSGIGTLIFKCLFGAFILIWKGIIKSSVRYKPLIIVYIVLTIVSFVSVDEFRNWAVIYIDILCIAIFGINELRIEYPEKKKRKYFNAVFEKVNLKTVDDYVPYYMYENDISEFVTAFAFRTVIPLNQWISKKEQLEMYINEKILDIIQDKENNRIIYIFIQKQPLPSKIEWNDEYINDEENILNIGMDCYDIIGMDLKKYPHAFIAGETGCGKSNVLKCLIHQAIIKEYDVILIDFKRGVSFSEFSEYVTIYYDYQKTAQILIGLVDETKRRLDLFRDNKVDNLDDYNNKSGDYLYRTIIFIDELAELLKSRDKAVASILNDGIETLTRLSRATGIHLIMGMQRPDSTIIRKCLKINLTSYSLVRQII